MNYKVKYFNINCKFFFLKIYVKIYFFIFVWMNRKIKIIVMFIFSDISFLNILYVFLILFREYEVYRFY